MPDTTSGPRPKNSGARGTSVPGADRGRRLSPVDGSFLRLESPQSHLHVSFSAVFAARSVRPRPSVEALRDRGSDRPIKRRARERDTTMGVAPTYRLQAEVAMVHPRRACLGRHSVVGAAAPNSRLLPCGRGGDTGADLWFSLAKQERGNGESRLRGVLSGRLEIQS